MKNKDLFRKTRARFLVESTKIKNATFPYEGALPETDVKKNEMGSTKWMYYKEKSFASSYFIFLKVLFLFKNLLKS